MRYSGNAGLPSASADPTARGGPLACAWDFLRKMLVIAELDARKLRHDPVELLTRAVQPALWLLIFGSVMNQVRIIPTGSIPYLDFMTPGVLAQSVLFISIFYGISIIFERDLGMVHKFLVSPISRTAIVAGKALSAGTRSLSQAVIIYILALVIGVHLVLDPVSIAEVVIVTLLGAAIFALMSMTIASIVKSRDRFMGIGQMITMPLFFASNAIYPISLMPDWLKVIAWANPLTYVVDALRGAMIVGGVSEYGVLTNLAILGTMAVVLLLISGRLYPRIGT